MKMGTFRFYLPPLLAALTLAGCASQGADQDAKRACAGYAGTQEYAACYAYVYPYMLDSRRAAASSLSSSMIGAGAAIGTAPSDYSSSRPVICNTVGSTVICQ